VELPFPADRETIESLIFSYLDEVRPPSSPVFAIDVSGSRKNERIDSLRLALKNLTGLDNSLTGKFAWFREREKIFLIPFNHMTFPVTRIDVDNVDAASASMEAIRQFVENLQADGGTAIYRALMAAYRVAGEQKKSNPDRFYSLVLLSDGKNEDKVGIEDFRHFLTSSSRPPERSKPSPFSSAMPMWKK
jgi:Ca-activated chloride channel family protein